MKSLFDQALSWPTLNEAWQRVRENKGCVGTDGETIEAFEYDLQAKLYKLRNEVLTGAYRPQPLLCLVVEAPGKKPRSLSIPVVRDRVLQTAVAIVLTPLFEAEFEDCSFAYRRGRSVDLAVRRVIRYRDEGFRWVVDADIASFFGEVDHELLVREVALLVPDERLLGLIQQWLKAQVEEDGVLRSLTKGLPQGSPLSPLLANLYLDHLDEALLEEDLRLVRFSDDFLILCRDRERAQAALELTEEVLETLRLKLNKPKSRIVNFDQGFRFLGVEFIRSLVLECEYPEWEGADFELSLPSIPNDDTGEAVEPRAAEKAPKTAAETEAPGALALALSEALKEKPVAAAPEPPSVQEEPELIEEQEPSSGQDPRLRTLYLMEHGCVLSREYERFVVRKEGQVVQEVPTLKVDQIMVFGYSQITTQAMTHCLLEKIPIVLLSGKGRYYGVVDSLDTDPVLLHRDQFRQAADADFLPARCQGHRGGQACQHAAYPAALCPQARCPRTAPGGHKPSRLSGGY